MSPYDALLLACATVVTYGYFCRLNALQLQVHRGDVIAMHLLAFGGCFWSGVEAWGGSGSIAHGCFVASSALWLTISLPTWRHGPPDHVHSDFSELER